MRGGHAGVLGGAMKKVSDVNDDVMWPRPPIKNVTKQNQHHLHTERFHINIYTVTVATASWIPHFYDPV